jgi:lipoyl(octanoyl) transferase
MMEHETDGTVSEIECAARAAHGDLVIAALGLVEYDVASTIQEELRARRIEGALRADVLLLLEHPPVYTLGRGATLAHLGAAAGGTVPVRRVGRGGQVTFHGPGQLVGYPIVDLARRTPDLHAYLRNLEDVLIRGARTAGVAAERVAGRTGVWVQGRKLASIGIGVRRWVTTHGFALNVTTDLTYFDAIVPCGIAGVRMTSLSAEGVMTDIGTVGAHVAAEMIRTLGYAEAAWVGRTPWRGRFEPAGACA